MIRQRISLVFLYLVLLSIAGAVLVLAPDAIQSTLEVIL